MGFRRRLSATCAALGVLIGLFVLGRVHSPDRVQVRERGAPLLPLASPAEIAAVEIFSRDLKALRLRRVDGGWQAEDGGRVFPASAARAEALTGLLAGMKRGPLVSSDPARRGELGLEGDTRLAVQRGGGRGELRLRIGARAPSGEEDYLSLEGQDAVYLVRGNLSVLLAQDRAYWLDLYVFPDEVRGATIRSIQVEGELSLGSVGSTIRESYTLQRIDGGWAVRGGEADALAAEAMAESLSRLEGQDLLAAAPTGTSGGLEVRVTTLDGRDFWIRAVGEGEGLTVTTSWSPWVYSLNPVLLARAVRPASELLAGR